MIKRLFLILALGMMMVRCLAADGNPASQDHQVLVMLRVPPAHFRPDAVYSGHYTDDAGRAARRRVAEDLASRHGLKLVTDWPMPTLNIDCYLMEGSPDQSAAQVAAVLSRDSRVEWAQPVNQYRGMGYNDPLYPVQPDAKYWHLDELHHVTTGRGVKIAIIDSGVDIAHPDLAGQVAASENFVDGNPYTAEMHGTGVAGIIAARADNGIGIVGVAPGARLLALRACWETAEASTRCNSFTLGKALNFAIMHDAQIINMSLTGPQDRLLRQLIDEALNRGIAVVSAVDAHADDGGFPASCPGVLAVAAQEGEASGTRALLAPGKDIPTTVTHARWELASGSSYAAAHVSGMLALLAERHPAMQPSQLRNKIALFPTEMAGAGTIDACASVGLAPSACTACSCVVSLGKR